MNESVRTSVDDRWSTRIAPQARSADRPEAVEHAEAVDPDPLPAWLAPVLAVETVQAFAAVQSRLSDELADRGVAAGVMDVGYDVVATPLGDLLLASSGGGLVRVAYAVEDHDRVLAALASRIGPRVLRARRLVAPAAEQVVSYLEGQRSRLDLPVDLRLSTGFRRRVLDVLGRLPRGATSTYAQVASAAGHPQAVRAVGSACATNPLPIVVPCHRVVRSDGSLGGYVGGLAAKRWLLDLESAG